MAVARPDPCLREADDAQQGRYTKAAQCDDLQSHHRALDVHRGGAHGFYSTSLLRKRPETPMTAVMS